MPRYISTDQLIFPAVVSGGSGGVGSGKEIVGGDGELELREQIIGPGLLNVGGVYVTVAKSVNRSTAGRLEF